MLCSGKQRARTEEDKVTREQQILDAAAALFAHQRYEQLTLADVATASGLTKAALYRYFRSKELLFIAVYRRAFAAFVDDLLARPLARLSDELTDTLLAHPLFCSLTAILHVALETGLSDQEAIDFKLFLLEQIRRMAARISALTGRDEASCFAYLVQCQQALIGCWHMAHPSETVRQAMNHPPLQVFRLDFGTTLRTHLLALTAAFQDSSRSSRARR